MYKSLGWKFLLLLVSTLFITVSYALPVTTFLEVQKLENVGAGGTVVTFENTYTNPVPVCTYVLPSSASNPATVRISGLSNSGMTISLQDSDGAVTAGDVHCIIAQEGAYTTAMDGIEFEARTVVSDQTNGSGRWQNSRTERVKDNNGGTVDIVTGNYANPALIGQVITSNDAAFSTFWANDCNGRGSPPTSNNMCVGKHNGKLGGGAEPANDETAE